MQSGELWKINERPSLRFVTDAINLNRSGSITLEVTEDAFQDVRPVSEDDGGSLLDNMEGDAHTAVAAAHDNKSTPASYAMHLRFKKKACVLLFGCIETWRLKLGSVDSRPGKLNITDGMRNSPLNLVCVDCRSFTTILRNNTR